MVVEIYIDLAIAPLLHTFYFTLENLSYSPSDSEL